MSDEIGGNVEAGATTEDEVEGAEGEDCIGWEFGCSGTSALIPPAAWT